MFAKALLTLLLAPILTYSQSTENQIVVCVPGQCLQGTSNISLGARFRANGFELPLHLLPGQYNDKTSPQYLHDVLTSSSVINTPSVGFPDTSRLPLNLQLQSGLAIYAEPRYSGQAAFSPLPTSPVVNASIPLNAQAIAISNNLVASITAGSSNRIVLWESVPDIAQLPAGAAGGLSLNNLESNACSPACSNAGLCSASGSCVCAPGFAGSSCEQCQPGFFGPQCQPCPSNCDECDQGISGTGRCLKPRIPNKPSDCNCANGACGANGQCQCTPGFETGSDGVACGTCGEGFFRSSTGDCKVCGLGCAQCEDTTGTCTSCRPGFTQDGSDRSICNAPAQVRSNGGICPTGSFANGGECEVCNSACAACTGPTANDCSACARGTVFLGGVCVTPNSNGVCPGSDLIADNVKRQCDTCGAKCTSCAIPNFSPASIINTRQCTGCIPGFFLSGGECVEWCPDGTFVGSDLRTCQACDSSCRTCADSATSCLTCSNNQLASGGRCVASCPSSTFPSSSGNSCTSCHPDCASCSGSAFNQCTTCPPSRPVLVNGRCLPTCTRTQYFDASTGTCQACDSSCSSCLGPGPANCASCSSSSSVLRQGSCVPANCQGTSSVIPGLGVCLSELVRVATPSSGAPPPTVSGIDTPTSGGRKLEWWQILLMALGCAFIFVVIVWLFRRRQKKKREEKTRLFGEGVKPVRKGRGFKAVLGDWRWKLIKFGERLFGHKRTQRSDYNFDAVGRTSTSTPLAGRKIVVLPYGEDPEPYGARLNDLRASEEGRASRVISPPIMVPREEEDMIDLIGSYQREPRKAPRPPSTLAESVFPSSSPAGYVQREPYRPVPRPLSASSRMSEESMYSQMTGMPNRAPPTRQPVKRELTSKFSMDTLPVPVDTKKSRNPFLRK